MALQIHYRPSFTKPYLHHLSLPLSKPKFIIKSQKPTIDTEPTSPNNNDKPKKVSPGQGFGSSSSSSLVKPSAKTATTDKKKQRGKKRERASIIRRSPVEKPPFVSKEEDVESAKEQSKNESAFLLAWLGLGGVILVQGIVLAASGFLPEQWDNFFVKYLYPSFTPTVGVFIAGTVAYGVLKYLQNEKLKG